MQKCPIFCQRTAHWSLWRKAALNNWGGWSRYAVNTLRPRQNGRHFTDDIFKCIFLNENAWITLKISLKLVSKVGINYIPALVQIMARRRPGDKPLSEPMIVSLLTHICVTRPQWVNTLSLETIRFHEDLLGVSLHLVSSQNEFSKGCKFVSDLQPNLYLKLNDGFASPMQSRHLISSTKCAIKSEC